MQIQESATAFLDSLFSHLQKHQTEIESYWSIDHICYRTATSQDYENLKKTLLQDHVLLVETLVNGRPICTFKLAKPIQFKHWHIGILELPAPKPGSHYKEGFEHIEVVSGLSFLDLQKRFRDVGVFEQAGKSFNNELGLKTSGGNLKFHDLSLESVVRLELKKDVMRALEDTQILKRLRRFNPLIVGTLPLGISTPDSDLDILVSAENFIEVRQVLEEGSFDLEIKEKAIRGEKSQILSFIYLGLKFEIFVQKNSSYDQWGYRHFLIEERILNLASADFSKKVRDLKLTGEKTEASFLQALGMDLESQDPFLEILKLEKLSDKEILQALSKLRCAIAGASS